MTRSEQAPASKHEIWPINDSGMSVGWIPGRLNYPAYSLSVIVKGTFDLKPGKIAEPVQDEPWPLSGDQYFDDEPGASLYYDSDFAYFKPGADLLLVGTCHVPEGEPRSSCPVSFTVGKWSKTLHVIGQRFWSSRQERALITEPIPFSMGPIRYEYAFGGESHSSNPLGKGIDTILVDGEERVPLPNIEAAERMITAIDQRPQPAGFAPLPRTWSTRAEKCGTYDDHWLNTRWPWLAEDIDWSYFNSAPPDQQLGEFLKGNESIVFENLHPRHPRYESALPGLRIRTFVQRRGLKQTNEAAFEEVAMNLDTLWVDMEEEKLVLIWRGATSTVSEFCEDIQFIYCFAESLSADPITASQAKKQMLANLQAVLQPPPPPKPPEIDDDIDSELAREEADMEQVLAEAGEDELPSLSAMAGPDSEQAKRKVYRSQLERMGRDPSEAGSWKPPPPESTQEQLRESGINLDLDKLDALDSDDPQPLDRDSLLDLIAHGESPQGRDLTGIDLSKCDLSGIDFSETILVGADLRGAKCIKTRFTGANLSQARLVMADLRSSDLYQTDLTAVQMMEADLSGCRLEGASLHQAILHSTKMCKVNARRVDFSGADLRHVDLAGSMLEESDFSESQLDHASLAGATATGSNFEQSTGDSANFTQGNLERVNFSEGCNFPNSIFRQVNADGTIWDTANLENCDFRESSLKDANFEACSLSNANFAHSDLARARFITADLSYTNFERANLFQGSLEKADLQFANLERSNLYEAETRDANLAEARFAKANLKMTKLADNRLSRKGNPADE